MSGVLVLYERGARGRATLAAGARLAGQENSDLTVLALAPQDTDPAVCGVYTEAFNEGVRSEAVSDLDEARSLLGGAGGEARYVILLGGHEPTLARFVAGEHFAHVLLPRPGRLQLRARRRARRLAAAEIGEIQLVSG